MARKKKEKTEEEGEPKEKGGLSRMIMVGVMSLSIAAAGYFIGGGGGGAAPAAAVPETVVVVEEEPAEPVIAKIVDLEAVNVNLTDNHYLRVAISLGIAEESHHEEEDSGGGSHGAKEEAAPEAEFPTAPAADLLLTTFAEQSMAQLSDAAGRSAARQHLEHKLKEYYGEEVIVTVFFTEFVMQ